MGFLVGPGWAVGQVQPCPGRASGPRASTGREEEEAGMWLGERRRMDKAVQHPLATPSSAESELQRDTTTRAEQEGWKRRK